jgi:hypothetical protein
MKESEDDYAHVQGVNVWEGDIGPLPRADEATGSQDTRRGDKARCIIEGDDGWEVIYQGQAPVAFVRTPTQNPMLGLTASITLRDMPARQRTHKSTMSVESVASEATYKEDAEGSADMQEDKTGEMEEIDLLGGLGGRKLTLDLYTGT